MSTGTQKKAFEVLQATETSLRRLISEAALEERYDEVAWLVDLAKQVSHLVARNSNADDSNPDTSAKLSASIEDRRKVRPPRPRSTKTLERAPIGNYPRFRTEKDRLVKVGWSKKKKSEYEHRAPKESMARVFDVIAQLSLGDSFEVEALLPFAEKDSQPIPSYQLYIAIGWLRDVGFLKKCGRNDYAISEQSKGEDFETCWRLSADTEV